MEEVMTPIQGDFSLKLNFDGALTLEIIQDALRGSQLLLKHTEGVLRSVLDIKEVTLSGVQVRKIEAGSFMGDLSAFLDSGGKMMEKAKDVPMGKFITVCATALLLAGIGCYAVLNMQGGDTTVGDHNTGIVGDNNQGNTITHNVVQGPTSAELAAALKAQFPDMDELCDQVAEAVVKKQQQSGASGDLKRASVYLSHPGNQSVSSIELANRPLEGSEEVTVKAVVDSDLIQWVPEKYTEVEPKEEKQYIKGIHIQIRRMDIDTSPEGKWRALVEDIETALPNKSLPLIVDNTAKSAALLRNMSKLSIKVNMWAVYKRDKKGNPQYQRYILDEVVED